MEVTLKMGERSKADFLAALRADLATVPGTQIVVGQPISHRIDHMLVGRPIEHRSQNMWPGFGRTTPLDRSDQGRGEQYRRRQV